MINFLKYVRKYVVSVSTRFTPRYGTCEGSFAVRVIVEASASNSRLGVSKSYPKVMAEISLLGWKGKKEGSGGDRGIATMGRNRGGERRFVQRRSETCYQVGSNPVWKSREYFSFFFYFYFHFYFFFFYITIKRRVRVQCSRIIVVVVGVLGRKNFVESITHFLFSPCK